MVVARREEKEDSEQRVDMIRVEAKVGRKKRGNWRTPVTVTLETDEPDILPSEVQLMFPWHKKLDTDYEKAKRAVWAFRHIFGLEWGDFLGRYLTTGEWTGHTGVIVPTIPFPHPKRGKPPMSYGPVYRTWDDMLYRDNRRKRVTYAYIVLYEKPLSRKEREEEIASGWIERKIKFYAMWTPGKPDLSDVVKSIERWEEILNDRVESGESEPVRITCEF